MRLFVIVPSIRKGYTVWSTWVKEKCYENNTLTWKSLIPRLTNSTPVSVSLPLAKWWTRWASLAKTTTHMRDKISDRSITLHLSEVSMSAWMHKPRSSWIKGLPWPGYTLSAGSTSVDDERTFSAVTQGVKECVSLRALEVKATIYRYRCASRSVLEEWEMVTSEIRLERG